MKKSYISPSLMCCDFFNLGKCVKELESLGTDYLHIDIMDGEFVPNYTLGTDHIKKLHTYTDIPQDIHLMITEPERKLDRFEIKKGDIVSVHYEASKDIPLCLDKINDHGAFAMLAINPNTPCDVVIPYLPKLSAVLIMTVYPGYAGQKLVEGSIDKIKEMRRLLNGAGYENVMIEVDGNVSFENAVLMKESGADIFVAGSSSVFSKDMTLSDAFEKFKRCVN